MKRLLYMVFTSILISGVSHAQDFDRTIDSLQNTLLQPGIEPYPILHMLAVQYVDRDNETALRYIEEAQRAALASGDSLSIVKSMRAKAQILLRLERISDLAIVLESVLPVSIRNEFREETVYLLNCLGAMNMLTGQLDRALSKFFESYEMAQEQKDSASVVAVLNNIGSCYYKLKDYGRAKMYYTETFTWRSSMSSSFPTDVNVSLCYLYLGDVVNAVFYLDQARLACLDRCDDHMATHISYVAGSIWMWQKQYEKAETEFLRSLDLAINGKDKRMQLDNIHSLVEIYLRENRITDAVGLLKQAELVIREGVPFNIEMIKIYSRLSDLYLRTNDYKMVACYQAKYIELRDSIQNETLTANLMRIETDFLQMRHKKQISAQAAIIKLKEEIIARQFRLNLFTALLVLVATAFLAMLFINLRRKKSFNEFLQAKVRERTRELERTLSALHGQIKERDLSACRLCSVMCDYFKRIEGLCSVAEKEVDANLPLYFSKIEENCRQALARLQRVQKHYFD